MIHIKTHHIGWIGTLILIPFIVWCMFTFGVITVHKMPDEKVAEYIRKCK